jgi:transcriptional regulator with XRE-family HTH domain
MENIFNISGKALKDARKAIPGLKQIHIAKKIGISRVTYTNWEGKEFIEIDKNTAKKLEEALGVSIDVLTKVNHDNQQFDILDHPIIKSLVSQSEYIMNRVRELEEENKALRGKK